MALDQGLTQSEFLAHAYRNRSRSASNINQTTQHTYRPARLGRIPGINNFPCYAKWLIRIKRNGRHILVAEGYEVVFIADGRISVDGEELLCEDGRSVRDLAEVVILSMEWVPATNDDALVARLRGSSLDTGSGSSGNVILEGPYARRTPARSAWRRAFPGRMTRT